MFAAGNPSNNIYVVLWDVGKSTEGIYQRMGTTEETLAEEESTTGCERARSLIGRLVHAVTR